MPDKPTDLRSYLIQHEMAAMGQHAPDPYSVMAHPDEDYMRRDGTKKGKGFLGMLPVQDGVATEFSIADSEDGPDYPSIVPTLDAAQLNQVLNGKVSGAVHDKARGYMLKRLAAKQPAFAQEGEQDATVLPMFRRVK